MDKLKIRPSVLTGGGGGGGGMAVILFLDSIH